MRVDRKSYPVAPEPLDERRFDVDTLLRDSGWKLGAPGSLLRERTRLAEWAAEQHDAIASYRHGVIDLPETTALAVAIREQLDTRSGVAWVTGIPVEGDPTTASLLYLALGAAMGEVIETYGPLYDVVDQGESYKKTAIPVSQTRESTGMHTDSSRLGNVPDYVGLLCQRPARSGGGSRIASATQAHEALRRLNPSALEVLYRDFIRDIVTPGADRDPASIADNRFPIFQHEEGLTLRYMRYWIETGHRITGVPILEEERKAMDSLDEELSREEHMFRLDLSAGDMLWIANRVVAHERDAYTEDPDHPRWLLRQWVRSPDAHG
ncbi:MAG TPA: hypothetical protein EYG54_04880 [Myxococcales bacterium]|nr:hypothetical protein [Myxococcales bacterium]